MVHGSFARLTTAFVCGVLLPLLAAAATAAGDADALWSRLEAQEQASGEFSQEIFSEEGELIERSSGRYAVLKPGYFRWDINYPDRQLLLVSGSDLWHYDIDLATATRRDAGAQGEFTPLELLTGDRADLAERFSVEQLEAGRFRLLPRFARAGFAAVELGWSGDLLSRMQIRDRSGQLISISLVADEDPPRLSDADFQLQLPDDVEVFDARGS